MKNRTLKRLLPLIILLLSINPVSTAVVSANEITNHWAVAEHKNLTYHRIDGEHADLSPWHPHYRERCYFSDRENVGNKHVKTIKELLNLLKKEPRLADYLLSEAKKLNTAFCIDERDDETRGYYDFKYNIIGLKEHLGLLEKLIIFVHELRHISQFTRGFHNSLNYDIEEIIRMNFAIEADVQAIVTLYAWRMKESEMDEVWKALSGFTNYIDIAEAFEMEIQRSGNELKATQAAFRQWYKSEWRVNKYYRNSYSWYVDMLDVTKIIQTYLTFPENHFERLCLLPCGKNYGCHRSEEIKETPQNIIEKAKEYSCSAATPRGQF